jgi:hypothetical protein
MTDKPSSLQLYLKDAGQLVRRDTLFAAAKKMEALKSLVQRQMARLKDSPYAYRELLQALAALLEPVAFDPFWVLLVLLSANTLEDVELLPVSAVRAYRAIWPDDGFDKFESCRFVLEMGLIENRH